ncbi:MAG TPA: hypothetical protein VGJ14_18140 [Sporichthyaceae bacterium]|jgi:hypothetical protein
MRIPRLTAVPVLLLLTAACGSHSQTTELSAPGPTATAGSDVGIASYTPLPSDLPITGMATPSAAAATGVVTGAPSAPAGGTGASSGTALPPPGDTSYRMTGQSSFGTLPGSLRLGVADAGGGSQTWTLDATNPDGSGMTEVLTVSSGPDGLYLSAYELQARGGMWHIDLHLAPAQPVPLVPNWPHGSWEFDMPSSNGCENAHTVGTVLPADNDGARHVKLVTTATPTGRADCPPISVNRTQELWLPGTGATPGRIDTSLSGSFGSVSTGENYSARSDSTT